MLGDKRGRSNRASRSLSPQQRPLLICLIGVNGAGKSSYYKYALRHLKIPFLNADVYAKKRWLEDADDHAYEAGQEMARQRAEFIERKQSFVTETVFSHPSKLELLTAAQANGYRTWLVYIHLQNTDLAKARIDERVSRGGHTVPPEKLHGRYQRLLSQLKPAIAIVDKAILLDNSSYERPFEHQATFESGAPVKVRDPIADWVIPFLTES